MRNLHSCESSKGPQRQSNLRFDAQGGMTTRENQTQPVIGIIHGIIVKIWFLERPQPLGFVFQVGLFVGSCLFPAESIEQLSMGYSCEPGARVVGCVLSSPNAGRD